MKWVIFIKRCNLDINVKMETHIDPQHPHIKFTKKSPVSENKKLELSDLQSNYNQVLHSKRKILEKSFSSSLNPFLEHMQDKEDFLKIFHHYFCDQKLVNLQAYQNKDFKPFGSRTFSHQITPFSIEDLRGTRVAAVDGGLGFHKFLGAQVTLIKVAGIMYNFKAQKPEIIPFSQNREGKMYSYHLEYGDVLDRGGRLLAGLRRQDAEISLLLSFLNSDPQLPDIVILDGSIIPPPLQSTFTAQDLLRKMHTSLVKKYLKLYTICEKKGVNLIGITKDTKSRQLRDLLIRAFPYLISKHKDLDVFHDIRYRDLLKGFCDTEMVYKTLDTNQRTTCFNIVPTLYQKRKRRNTSGFSPYYFFHKYTNFDHFSFGASYLQISPYDFPLRIETVGKRDIESLEKRIKEISEILLPISKINKSCVLPIPQIEAHLRAHLRNQEFEMFLAHLQRKFKVHQLKKLEKVYSPIQKSLPQTNHSQNQKDQIFHLQDFPDNSFANPHTDQNINIPKTILSEKFLREVPVKTYHSTFFEKRHNRLDSLF